MSHPGPFKPFFFLKNPHLQTLISYILQRYPEPCSKTHFLNLSDQDRLALEINTPKDWKENDPTVLMMHGIGGSAKSPYLVRMANKLEKQQIQAVRLNFRGIGNGEGEAKKISHGGSSQDIFEAIQFLKNRYPNSPLIVVGFSLSGNILLKLAGEKKTIEGVKKIIAVCPSINLKDSAIRLEKWENRVYQRSILQSIIRLIESKKSQFAYKAKRSLKTCKTLRDFDNLYTAPSSGFLNGEDYYQKSSSLEKIPHIEMPCHLLFAEDDPLIDCKSIQSLNLSHHIELVITKHGGHMGFLQRPKKKNFFWMDELLIHWITKE